MATLESVENMNLMNIFSKIGPYKVKALSL